MKPAAVFLHLVVVCLMAAQSLSARADNHSSSLELLEAEIARLSQQAEGRVGVSATLLGSGHKISVNASETYPMASTYKVAIAAYAFYLIDQNKLSLDQMITIEPRLIAYPGQPIASNFLHDGIALSLHNLLELTLTHSDNTATDVVLEAVGGASRVSQWLRSNGISELRVDRPTSAIIRALIGVPAPKDMNQSPKDHITEVFAGLSDEEADAAFSSSYTAFGNDPRDQSTPEAMTLLLSKIWSGAMLSAESTKALQSIMERCVTGPNRLKGLLPLGTTVAHKTGTGGKSLNDVGVVYLPNGEYLVMSVFTKDSENPDWSVRERAIAEISRAVYDYYLFRAHRL